MLQLPKSLLALMTSPSDEDRLPSIQKRWQDFPGSAPGGTGATGLATNDAQGWSDQQNENTWALNALNAKQGKGPMNVRYGGEIRQPEPQYSPDVSPWGLGGYPASIDGIHPDTAGKLVPTKPKKGGM